MVHELPHRDRHDGQPPALEEYAVQPLIAITITIQTYFLLLFLNILQFALLSLANDYRLPSYIVVLRGRDQMIAIASCNTISTPIDVVFFLPLVSLTVKENY